MLPYFNKGNDLSRSAPGLEFLSFTGKLRNIEGIAKSTEDDINTDNIAEIAKSTTEDYHFTPSRVPGVKQALKPKTIPQGILNRGFYPESVFLNDNQSLQVFRGFL